MRIFPITLSNTLTAVMEANATPSNQSTSQILLSKWKVLPFPHIPVVYRYDKTFAVFGEATEVRRPVVTCPLHIPDFRCGTSGSGKYTGSRGSER